MYWPTKGAHNTSETVKLALQRARELNLKHLVVASNTGTTAEKFLGNNLEVVCVTHHAGYAGPGKDEMEPEFRQRLQEQGVKILTTTHLLAGVDRSLRAEFKGIYPAEIIAMSLRMLGQGLKVCVEISVMALDSGLIPYGEEIVAVGGTSRGADTACIIVPDHSRAFFNTVVKEIICMPREK
ncbi:MAG TPA: hypothetical protein GX693_07535 [Firmicutes bacterium]|nr:hypothetical protein [Bacillota bacterium]